MTRPVNMKAGNETEIATDPVDVKIDRLYFGNEPMLVIRIVFPTDRIQPGQT